jgi:uracil-DNA glycosylase family 4
MAKRSVRVFWMPDFDDPVCRGCPYHHQRSLAAPAPEGRRHVPLETERHESATLLIFQAPGSEEWRKGRPLISRESPHSAAARLRNAWTRLGLRREDFDITNAVQCFPGTGNPRDKPPLKAAISACSQWLQRTIELGAYTKIVAFGRVAEAALGRCNLLGAPSTHRLRHPNGNLRNADLDTVLQPPPPLSVDT